MPDNNFIDLYEAGAYFNIPPEDQPTEEERREIEKWMAQQPPMIEELDARDGEDTDCEVYIEKLSDGDKDNIENNTFQDSTPTPEEIADFHRDMANGDHPFDLKDNYDEGPFPIEGDESPFVE